MPDSPGQLVIMIPSHFQQSSFASSTSVPKFRGDDVPATSGNSIVRVSIRSDLPSHSCYKAARLQSLHNWDPEGDNVIFTPGMTRGVLDQISIAELGSPPRSTAWPDLNQALSANIIEAAIRKTQSNLEEYSSQLKQQEDAQKRHFQLLESTFEQLLQTQQYLQTVEPYATGKIHIAQIAPSRRHNIYAEESQNLEATDKDDSKRVQIDLGDECFKMAMRPDGPVVKEIEKYRRRVQEHIDKILEDRIAEFNTARATSQPPFRRNTSQWKADLKTVDGELQDSMISGAHSEIITGLISAHLKTPETSSESIDLNPFLSTPALSSPNPASTTSSIAKLSSQNTCNPADNPVSGGSPNEAVTPSNLEPNGTESFPHQQLRFLNAHGNANLESQVSTDNLRTPTHTRERIVSMHGDRPYSSDQPYENTTPFASKQYPAMDDTNPIFSYVGSGREESLPATRGRDVSAPAIVKSSEFVFPQREQDRTSLPLQA
ncbi:hypothetical protein C8R46DRAFT_1035774 [Mycena filopes]|nr:hypothetical protein C8R46DRAFT_1035774 [Mycena filopes]